MLQWLKQKKEKSANHMEETQAMDPQVLDLKQKADQGDAEAQYQIGLLYLEGEAVKKNEKLAAEFLQKATDQGHLDAQRKLAWCYLYGRGVKQNLSHSLKLSQDADGTHEKVDMNKFGYLIRK